MSGFNITILKKISLQKQRPLRENAHTAKGFLTMSNDFQGFNSVFMDSNEFEYYNVSAKVIISKEKRLFNKN